MAWKKNETDAFMKLRIPAELKDWLRRRAEAAMRPLNSEIVLALLEARAREESVNTNHGRNK